jgi:GGDEF domain-containing protein
LPALLLNPHNWFVREKSGAYWVVVHSLPQSKTFLLKNILAKRFPRLEFHFSRFPQVSKSLQTLIEKSAGVLLELKTFDQVDRKALDKICRWTEGKSVLSILSPEAFHWIQKTRAEFYHRMGVLISELKSLDYLVQIPRLIEEVQRKHLLRSQNERLRRLVAQAHDAAVATRIPPDFTGDFLEGVQEKNLTGLKVTIKKWTTTRRRLGEHAEAEVLDSIGRLINNAVRNSDRVLRWKDDEFLVLLSNTEPRSLESCRNRLQSSLGQLSLSANHRSLEIPFDIRFVQSSLS